MKKRVRIVSLILALLVANVLPLPLLGVAETGDEALTYTFPSEAYGTIDTRYVRVEVDKLDACLYAYLDKDGNVAIASSRTYWMPMVTPSAASFWTYPSRTPSYTTRTSQIFSLRSIPETAPRSSFRSSANSRRNR